MYDRNSISIEQEHPTPSKHPQTPSTQLSPLEPKPSLDTPQLPNRLRDLGLIITTHPRLPVPNLPPLPNPIRVQIRMPFQKPVHLRDVLCGHVGAGPVQGAERPRDLRVRQSVAGGE